MVPEGLAEFRPLGRQDPRQGRFGEFDGIHGLGLLAALQGYMSLFKVGSRVGMAATYPREKSHDGINIGRHVERQISQSSLGILPAHEREALILVGVGGRGEMITEPEEGVKTGIDDDVIGEGVVFCEINSHACLGELSSMSATS